jgi:hypothetical protein
MLLICAAPPAAAGGGHRVALLVRNAGRSMMSGFAGLTTGLRLAADDVFGTKRRR